MRLASSQFKQFSQLGKMMLVFGCLITMGDGIVAQTVLRDYRVKDIAVTPALGRGYSLSTNTYQSVCLSDVQTTEPSYDFDYTFFEVNDEFIQSTTSSNSNSKASSQSSSHTSSYSSSCWWCGSKSSGTNTSSQSSSVATQNTSKTTSDKSSKTKILGAILKLSTYYAAVDESASPLSKSALKLAMGEDIPGFFAACGAYYVRGITRRAEFQVMFKFTATTEEQSRATMAAIKRSATRASSYTRKSSGWRSKSSSSGQSRSSESSSNRQAQQDSSTMSKSDLRITMRGIGLGKNESGSLIATNIEEFREALKDAFLSMQKPNTGRVTSVELAAWAENSEFQANLNMREKDLVSGKSIPLYSKKDILTFNAEFLAEMNRSLRQRITTYYSARNCNAQLKSLKKEKNGGKKILTNLIEQRPGKTVDMLLKDELSDTKVQNLFNKDYLGFLTGNPVKSDTDFTMDDTPPSPSSYEGCVDSILRGKEVKGQDAVKDPTDSLRMSPEMIARLPEKEQERVKKAQELRAKKTAIELQARQAGAGIFLRRWVNYKGCKDLQSKFIGEPQPMVDAYCMPTWSGQYSER